MSSTRNTKTKKKPVQTTPETTSQKAPADKLDLSHLTQEQLGLLADCYLSLLSVLTPQKGKAMDDVRIFWNVTAFRGEDTFVARVNGTSTLDALLNDNNLLNSSSIIDKELTDKVLMPILGVIQQDACRRAMEVADELNQDQFGM